MRAKRFLLSSIIFFILLLLTPHCVLAASKKQEQAVTKQINHFMKSVTKYDQSKSKKSFANPDDITLIYDKRFSRFIRDKQDFYLNYEIKSVKAKGKRATAKVKVTYYTGYYATWYALKQSTYDIAIWNKKLTSKLFVNHMENFYEQYQLGYSILGGYKKYDKLTKTKTISIPLVKVNGKWKIEEMTPQLYRIIDCEIRKAYYDVEDNPEKVFDMRM